MQAGDTRRKCNCALRFILLLCFAVAVLPVSSWQLTQEKFNNRSLIFTRLATMIKQARTIDSLNGLRQKLHRVALIFKPEAVIVGDQRISGVLTDYLSEV
jgi:hypothetical protein